MEGYGDRLGRALGLLGISPAEAARRAQTSTANLSRWLDGGTTPSIEKARQVAGALGLSLCWLVEGRAPMLAADVGGSDRGASAEALGAEIRAGAFYEAAGVLQRMADATRPPKTDAAVRSAAAAKAPSRAAAPSDRRRESR